MGDCFKSTGKIVERDRAILPFDRLEIHDRINVFLTYAPNYNLRVKAGRNLLQLIDTEVKDNTLIIENNNKCNWVRSFKKEIDVYVSTPNLRKLTYYGSADVRFTNPFVIDTLLINTHDASGDIYLNLMSDYVELKCHTGSVSIKSEGIVNELICFMGANGRINTLNTISNKVLAVNENTGKLSVHATQELNAEIRGIGDIEYFGNPTIKLIDDASGNLISLN